MKKLSNLKGAKMLNRKELTQIKGGGARICCEWCPDGTCAGWVSSPGESCPFTAACE